MVIEKNSEQQNSRVEDRVTNDKTSSKATDSFLRIQDLYKDIIENLVDGVLCINLTAEILFANQAVYKILEAEPPDLIGRSIYEFVPQKSRKLVIEKLKQRAQGESSEYKIDIEVNGKAKLMSLRAQPVFNTDGDFEYSLAIVTELTEQERLKTQLQETEHQLTHVFANISEGLLIINADNEILLANYAASRIFEVQTGTLVGQNLNQLFEKSQMKIVTFEHSSYQAPGSNRYEVELTLSNGRKKYLVFSVNSQYDSTGAYTGAFGIVADITETKQTERLLLEKERLFTRSQQVAKLGYIEMNLVTGEINGSPQMHCIFELEPGEPLPAPQEYINKYVHPDDVGKYTKDYEKYQNGITVLTEHRIITSKGNIKFLKAVVEPEVDSKGDLVKLFASVTDETELQVAKLSQIEFEERFYAIFQYAPDAIAITNIETSEILAANRNIYRILGYKPEEIIGKRILDLKVWATTNHRNALLDVLQRDKRIHNFTTEFYNKNGEIKSVILSAEFIEINSKPCGMFIIHDITDLIKTQKALLESEEKFRSLIEQMNEGLIITDKFHKLIYCNDQVCLSLKRERAEIINKQLSDFNVKITGSVDYNTHISTVMQGNISKLEAVLSTPENDQVFINISSKPLFKRGEFHGAVNIVTDITELKQIQIELQENINQLQSTLEEIKTLSGLLPICSYCKKIRNDDGYWLQLEEYISTHSAAKFTHSICNDCIKKLL